MAARSLLTQHSTLRRVCSSYSTSKYADAQIRAPLLNVLPLGSWQSNSTHQRCVRAASARDAFRPGKIFHRFSSSSKVAHLPKAASGAGDSVPLPPPSGGENAKSESQLPSGIGKKVQTSFAELFAESTHAILRTVINAGVAYDRSLQTNPILTKATTCFITFMLGDIIAQSFQGKDPLDLFRMVRLGMYGLIIDGPFGHAWYSWLDKNVYPEDPNSNKAVLAKTAADQLVWSVAMTPVFFAAMRLFEGRPDLILSTIERKMLPTLLANYLVWPVAHLINFKFIPTSYRLLYNNIVCIAWTTFMSWITYQAVHHV